MYIEERIGDDYQKWEIGQDILISAPTGSGKSSFIFSVLLKWAINKGWKILYLVNRKILQSQLMEKLEYEVSDALYNLGIVQNPSDFLKIKTYQSVEKSILEGGLEKIYYEMRGMDIVVYDECHYFYTDALFNTNTEISYDFLRKTFDSKLQIFMTATMDKIKEFIYGRQPFYWDYWVETQNPKDKYVELIRNSVPERKYKEYTIRPDYSYINVHSFGNLEELRGIIEKSKDKWLIFIDSISQGIEFQKELLKTKFSEDEVVFIDADYKNDNEANASVDSVVKYNFTPKKILITTSVMDNGISFEDGALRNLVILYDTKEVFIQMLGRKRQDGKPVNLYICRRDSAHFSRRAQYLDKVLKIYNEQRHNFEFLYNRMLPYVKDGKVEGTLTSVTPFFDFFYRTFYSLRNPQNYNEVYNHYINFSGILCSQQKIMNRINKSATYPIAKAFTYSLGGLYAINHFSLKQCRDMRLYYRELSEKLKNDQDAFLKIQSEWLGKDNKDISDVNEMTQEEVDNHKTELNTIIKRLIEETAESGCFDKERNIKFKEEAKSHLKFFYSRREMAEEKVLRQLGQNERSISPDVFNVIMEKAELPYRMEKEGKSDFKIELIK